MTLTRQLRHKARAERAAQAIRDRELAELEERRAKVKEPGTRVEVRYLNGNYPDRHPVFDATVIEEVEPNVVRIERDEPDEFRRTTATYHVDWLHPIA